MKSKKKNQHQMKGAVNKKILILICVIIVVIVLIPLLLSKSSQSQKPQTNTTIHSNSPSASTLITYHNNSYALSYPNTWSKTENELSNGNLVVLQPQSTNSGQYEKVGVEVLDGRITPINSITNILKILNYTETKSTVGSYIATKYTAVLPAHNGKLHSIIYLFQQNQKIYSLKLEYIQPNTNTQLEDQFYQIVSSFSLQ